MTTAIRIGGHIFEMEGEGTPGDPFYPVVAAGAAPIPTSGGPTVARVASLATTNATSVKASAGQIYGWYLYNTSAVEVFVKIYNKAAAPDVGTDVPAFTIPLPANGGAVVPFSQGIPLAAGIAYAITAGVADADVAAVGANDVHGFILYK